MPQTLKRKEFGELHFIRTWVNGNLHIGQLAEGGYAHIGGMPVTLRSEIEDTIPGGKFLEEALNWFDNKDKIKVVQKAKKRLLIDDKGDYVFEDGSPVTGVGDLVGSLPKGPALDASIVWWVAKTQGISQDKVSEKEFIAAKSKEMSEAKFICEICGKACKTPVALKGHMRSHPISAESQEAKAA